MSREWALWAVRNLCAGSRDIQKRIEDLEVGQVWGGNEGGRE